MDCAGFENRLADLMEGERDEQDRTRIVGELRGHAGDCEECRAALDLVELASRSVDRRDLVDLPDDAYWTDFNARVRGRIEKAETPAVRGAGKWIAAAAILVLVSGLGWRILGPGQGPDDRGSLPGAPTASVTVEALPDTLARMLRDSPVEAIDELGYLLEDGPAWDVEVVPLPEAGAPDGGGDGWLFPATRDLDEDARRELLRWLEEQSVDEQGVT